MYLPLRTLILCSWSDTIVKGLCFYMPVSKLKGKKWQLCRFANFIFFSEAMEIKCFPIHLFFFLVGPSEVRKKYIYLQSESEVISPCKDHREMERGRNTWVSAIQEQSGDQHTHTHTYTQRVCVAIFCYSSAHYSTQSSEGLYVIKKKKKGMWQDSELNEKG